MIGPFVVCAVLAAFPQLRPATAETVIRLTVDPMPAPKPALRYTLLPDLKEMTPGNPIPNYLACLLDQDFGADQEIFGKAALRQADRAARMDKPDWQIILKIRTDGVDLLLPDVQKLRALAAALQVRFREEVAAKDFAAALVSAKTVFAMARHLGEHPTLIGGLVGIAIAQVGVAPLEEMLEKPGCPNLYWALTHLPAPLVGFDKGMEGERVFIQAELRDLSDADPMTAEQIKKVVARVDYLRDMEAKPTKTTRRWLDERAKDAKYLAAARTRLAEAGLAADRLAKFPADQITLLDEKREYEVRRDEVIKFTNLPTWQALAGIRTTRPAKEAALFGSILPGLDKVRRAQGRIEQRVALLRHVEALRLYAADHGGKLPATLADVSVPLPADPFTGKPFRYEVTDGTAHIRGTPPAGEEQNPPYNLHYEITIRK